MTCGGGRGLAVKAARIRLISGTVSGIIPGSAGGSWPGSAAGCLAAGAGAEQGGGDGTDREGGHDQHDVAQDRGVEPGLALVQAEAVLPEFEIFFYWPSQPCGPDQPGLGQQLAFGHVAVMEGELAGLQVAADEQAVPGRGGGEPGPGVPALALGARAGGADLPCPAVLQQRLDGLRAGQLRPAGRA